ncbi:MAG TPA: hypothetical protein EYG46_00305 [Myxococcales bacterium]|nr:hypothetical protein [Myxococcales bacterium]HIL99419.1 hypothetical protein [Myxococcales bacterium]
MQCSHASPRPTEIIWVACVRKSSPCGWARCWSRRVSRRDAAIESCGLNREPTAVAIENTSATESRIRDVDFAQETAELTRKQVLQLATHERGAYRSARLAIGRR